MCQAPVMTWPQRLMPPDATEMAALAHGPRVLAQEPGLIVGLRSIVAYSSGLDLAVVAMAYGARGKIMEELFQAPAELDPVTGHPHRGRWTGEYRQLQVRALEDAVLQPVPRRSTQGFHQQAGSYRREYLYEISPLPETTELPLITAWPALGLAPVTTHLELPAPAVLRAGIVPLVGEPDHWP